MIRRFVRRKNLCIQLCALPFYFVGSLLMLMLSNGTKLISAVDWSMVHLNWFNINTNGCPPIMLNQMLQSIGKYVTCTFLQAIRIQQSSATNKLLLNLHVSNEWMLRVFCSLFLKFVQCRRPKSICSQHNLKFTRNFFFVLRRAFICIYCHIIS